VTVRGSGDARVTAGPASDARERANGGVPAREIDDARANGEASESGDGAGYENGGGAGCGMASGGAQGTGGGAGCGRESGDGVGCASDGGRETASGELARLSERATKKIAYAALTHSLTNTTFTHKHKESKNPALHLDGEQDWRAARGREGAGSRTPPQSSGRPPAETVSVRGL
jgi:hypothetical protein